MFLDSSNRDVYGRALADGVELRFQGGIYETTWETEFYPPSGKALTTGFYSGAVAPSYRDENHPGMRISGGLHGGGGTFEVRDIAWGADGSLQRFWAVWVQQGKFGYASFGEVRFNAATASTAAHATPTRVRWPSDDLGRLPAIVPVRVAPSGGSVRIDSVSVSDGDAGSFPVQSDACTGRSVSAGSFCEVHVAFRPSSPGTRASTLRITDSAGSVLKVPLQGYSYGGRTRYAFESDPGDFIGQGNSYTYVPADGTLDIGGSRTGGSFGVDTDDWWSGRFVVPQGESLRLGVTYTGAERYPYHGDGAGLTVMGEGRACDQSRGEFTVHELELDGDGRAAEMVVTFEQHCEYAEPAFRGRVEFRAGNDVPPPPWGLPYSPAGATTTNPAPTDSSPTDPTPTTGGGNAPSSETGSDPGTAAPDAEPPMTGEREPMAVKLRPSKASRRAADRRVRIVVRPRRAAPKRVVKLAFKSRARLGSYRGRLRAYRVRVRGPAKSGCVRRARAGIVRGRRGQKMTLRLNPRRTKAGRWCRGKFRGVARYVDAFVCPDAEACSVPGDFKTLQRRVGRFRFRVR